MENYDPQAIVIDFGGILIRGTAKGSFVKVTQEADTFTDVVGNDGSVTRVRNRDERGNIVITIMAESVTNDQLSAVHLADKEFGLSTKGVLIKDLKGTTLVTAKDAWIMKFAEIEYGDDGGSREWTIRCAKLVQYVGGSL